MPRLSYLAATLALVLVGALALAGGLTGCGPDLKTSNAELQPIPADLDAPVYVVVNDVTTHDASVSAARTEAFGALLRAAWERRAGVVLVTVGSASGSVHTVFSTVAVADDVNADFTARRQANATRTMKDLFRASDRRQTGGAADVLGAVREVQAQLRSVGNGDYQLLVMSSGLLRRPIDVKAQPQFLADPAATAAELADAARLPDLQGWSLAFLDAGDAPGDQSQALAALWWHIARAAHGQLTGFQQTVVNWPLPAMSEPRPPVLVRVPAAADKVVVSVADRVLFDVDESALRPDAAAAISQLASLLQKDYPEAPATITGYTDSTGGDEYNVRLSRARAAAVAAALVDEGVSGARLTVAGLGASDFVASNATAAGRAANRRTEISLQLQ
jgi:outer membrane protein OmpA-like peptidoglycan-associated protein